MKKLTLLPFMIFIFNAATAQNKWSIGLEWSGYGNYSEFSGGMPGASALFTNNVFPSPQISMLFRYRYSEHWSLRSGFKFGEIGFSYLLSRDYDLTNPEEHFDEIHTSTCISQIPFTAIYNSKLNCKNVRFIAGAGFAINGIDKNWISSNVNDSQEETAKSGDSELSVNARTEHTSNCSFTWLIGAEKVFRRGNMLSFTLQGNYGFKPLATSTVNYSANGSDYTHSFSNYGSWCGVGITYYFLPIGSKKALRLGNIQ